jgi:hypothetical protein
VAERERSDAAGGVRERKEKPEMKWSKWRYLTMGMGMSGLEDEQC